MLNRDKASGQPQEFAALSNVRIIYSHPARQANIPERPLRMHQRGIDVLFLTGLYFNPGRLPYSAVSWLPRSISDKMRAQLEKRRVPGLPDDKVISASGVLPEVLLRQRNLVRSWNAIHDWYVSRYLRKLGEKDKTSAVIFHGFQGSCQRSLVAAKEAGMITAVEITQPLVANSIITEERRHLGLPIISASPGLEDMAEVSLADFVIIQSEWSETGLRKIKSDVNVLTVPLGVDIELFRSAEDHTPGFNVLSAGQLCIRKGTHHVLEAWSELSLVDAKLWLVGVPTDEVGHQAVKSGSQSIEYLGFQTQVRLAELYRKAHVFVGPSLSEAGFNSLHEAAASGLPCIVSERAGSLVRDGVEGFVISAGDCSALKNRLVALYNDEELRTKMGKAARHRAEQFSWDRFGDRLRCAYAAMLTSQGSGAANDTHCQGAIGL